MALFALALAMPVALGIAIFLAQYSPRRVTGPLAYVVELLAAVPRSSTGMGSLRAGPAAATGGDVAQRLWVGFPVRNGNASPAGGGTIFAGGIVLAVMILPIITAVTREVLVQTPQDQIEAVLALGATRWEVVKTVTLPFGRSGYVSGCDARAGPRPGRDGGVC